jgi:hypothetical protein
METNNPRILERISAMDETSWNIIFKNVNFGREDTKKEWNAIVSAGEISYAIPVLALLEHAQDHDEIPSKFLKIGAGLLSAEFGIEYMSRIATGLALDLMAKTDISYKAMNSAIDQFFSNVEVPFIWLRRDNYQVYEWIKRSVEYAVYIVFKEEIKRQKGGL